MVRVSYDGCVLYIGYFAELIYFGDLATGTLDTCTTGG